LDRRFDRGAQWLRPDLDIILRACQGLRVAMWNDTRPRREAWNHTSLVLVLGLGNDVLVVIAQALGALQKMGKNKL
jgi:hypothetical protein